MKIIQFKAAAVSHLFQVDILVDPRGALSQVSHFPPFLATLVSLVSTVLSRQFSHSVG